MRKSLSLLFLILLLLVGLLVWFLFGSPPAPQQQIIERETETLTEIQEPPETVVETLEEEIQELNPVENSNPFSDAYQNPFAQ